MSLLQNSNAISSGSYDINNSLRFRSSASAYLNRTPASAGTRTTWTWSGWVKRGALSAASAVISCGSYSTNLFQVYFDSSDQLYINNFPNSTTPNVALYTTQVFRDPSAWYHIVVVMDTTQATSSNRVKIYINGSQVTAFSTATYPAQNATPNWNTGSLQHNLGARDASTLLFDGYMTEINFIDGQALTPSSFGETDTTTGSWKPKAYSGTYGTNGFYLKFADASAATAAAIGKDSSGNGNNWTPSGISVTAGTTYDAMLDVPTNTSATVANYCVINPLFTPPSGWTASAITAGNLNAAYSTGTVSGSAASFCLTGLTGKYYWEATLAATPIAIGLTDSTFTYGIYALNNTATSVATIRSDGSNVQTGLAAFAIGGVVGVAVDMSANTVQFYYNNSAYGTAVTLSATAQASQLFPIFTDYGSAAHYSINANFGQQGFKYTPPTGFVALNTYNLPTPTILQGNKYMDATLYSGSASAQTITNAGAFKPDFVWIKSRSDATGHLLEDTVRGALQYLGSETTAAESTLAGSITSFNSNGFSVGTQAGTNYAGRTFVAWQWQAGQGSTSSNTSGSITSTVSVNTTAGFSVATFTIPASGTTFTVGHGLGVAPKFVAFKTRSGTSNWISQHTSTGTQYVMLNSTAAATTDATIWNSAPTSSVVNFGTAFISSYPSNTAVMYCWAEIAGYSKFGSYTGNGSADGPMIFTGFSPKYWLVKRTDSADDWFVFDSAREPYNTIDLRLCPNGSFAEASTTTGFDFLANGVKVRSSGTAFNANGGTYIYMAFAESPFKSSLAR